MSWSPKNLGQETALKRVNQWMKDPSSKVFYLGGYAGTGKTELAKHFAEGVNGMVCFGAYTGKAVLILIQRGCFNARTIHSWLYKPANASREHLENMLRALTEMVENEAPTEEIAALQAEIEEEEDRLSKPNWRIRGDSDLAHAKLVILDECSMINKQIAEDLLHVCDKILVLGDPAQLPPVKNAGYFTSKKPDYTLTEVVRHDNGILDLATRVRHGQLEIPYGRVSEDVTKVRAGSLTKSDYASADQIITGKNDSRMNLNVMIREELGRNGLYPVDGDKVICLKNNRRSGLVNGQIEVVSGKTRIMSPTRVTFKLKNYTVSDPDADPEGWLTVYPGHFKLYENPKFRLARYWDRLEMDEFDYGYAITVHKAQGSQWDHPWLCDDGFQAWNRKDRQRWLYTAITRAVNHLTIVG